MARLDSYPLDPIAEGDDKILATDKDGVVTKNLTVTSVVNYVNSVRGGGYPISASDGTELLLAVWPDGRVEAIPKASTAPNITSLPVITGTLNVGETLTVTPGAFTGMPEPTTVLQWQRSDDGLTGWADIAGATSVSYLLGSLDEDKYIRVQQTEENILGTATANSVSTTQIQPAAFSGLLDEYPNAAAAYSLRKLRALYSGSAIKVRRASDNALQDIGFDSLTNELDVTSLESFCSGTDGFVQTWYDQSGNGVNATQTTAAEQPKIVSIGSTILEGTKPTIQWDGSNDKLALSPVITGATARSFFIANKLDSTGGAGEGGLISLNEGSNPLGSAYRILRENSDIRLRVSGSSGFSYPSGTTALDYNVLTNIWTSGGSQDAEFWSNGVSAPFSTGTSSNLNTVNTGNHFIGWYDASVRTLNGNIQEMIIYASDQSSNRTGIETNINNFYSIY